MLWFGERERDRRPPNDIYFLVLGVLVKTNAKTRMGRDLP